LSQHPLAFIAPEPITQEWLWEVSRFAVEFQRLLDRMRLAHPDSLLDSQVAPEELNKGWGSRIDRDYLAACYEHFCTDVNDFGHWWEYVEPDLDLVRPLQEALELRRQAVQ